MPKGGAPTFCHCGRQAMARMLCANHYKQWQYRQNPEKYRNWEKARREREGDRMRAADRERFVRDRDKRILNVKACSYRRRTAKGRASGPQIAARVAYYGGRCYMCGGPYEHIDHVIPLARGGTNWPANLRPACAKCNLRKGDR